MSYETVYECQQFTWFSLVARYFGTKWRMLEMQAVIGRIQLKYLSEWKAKRQQNASRLLHSLLAFAGARGVVGLPKIDCTSCLGQCGGAAVCTAMLVVAAAALSAFDTVR